MPGSKTNKPQAKAAPATGVLTEIPPEKIRENEENPRMFFEPEGIETLAESIKEKGVLVPVTVYEHKDAATKTTHVLLDGARRFRAAKLANLERMPALVVSKPTGTDNALLMFNIHMLREPWNEIATAWALEKVLEQLGDLTDDEIRRRTGLSKSRIRNIKIVLGFPRKYQRLIAEGEIPFNLLVELDKAVLSWQRRHPKGVLGEDAKSVMDTFLEKYQRGTLGDVVDLRKVGELLRFSQTDGFIGKQAKAAVKQLIKKPDVSVMDAYREGAAASSEMVTILRDLNMLPGRIGYLLSMELHTDQMKPIRNSIKKTRDQLSAFLDELEA